jgi:tetratricopeptide (TPR) repeat protein
MKRILVMMAMAMLSVVAFALPTIEAVQAEVQRGNYTQAERMMSEVVAARPDSAKAHYVYAEILAHDGRFDLAAREARLARQIAPDLNFTEPDKFRAFEQLLARERGTAKPLSNVSSTSTAWAPTLHERQRGERNSSFPAWGWGLGGAAITLLLWLTAKAVRQAAPAPTAYAPTGYGSYGSTGSSYAAPGQGSGPTYGSTSAAPSAGSGMLGAGIAAAGGLAAGVLAEKLLAGGRERDISSAAAPAPDRALLPGASGVGPMDNQAAGELEQRPVDFGSGGDWESDSGSGDGNDNNDW